MRTKWLICFSILAILFVLGLGAYITTQRPATVMTESAQAATAVPNTSAISDHNDKITSSEFARESSHTNDNQSSNPDQSARDFSGVTTIDPALSTPTPTPKETAEVKEPLPLVFKPVDPGILKLTPAEQAVIDELQQTFLDRVGGAGQSANDPGYRERWQEARPVIDQLLKTELGQTFFLRYETATAR